MRKILLYTVPTLTLILFVIVMNSGYFLKKSFGDDDNVHEKVQQLEQHVKNSNWMEAEKDIDKIEIAWNKVVHRIQFSVEKEYMLEINGALSRIKGGVEAKDKEAILEEIYFYYELWDRLAT